MFILHGAALRGTEHDEELGDLLYRLVQAPDPEAAFEKAMQLGQESGDEYQGDDGKTYMFQFLGLADLTELQATHLADGVEVYSQLTAGRPSDMVVAKEELTVFEPGSETTTEAFGNEAITPK